MDEGAPKPKYSEAVQRLIEHTLGEKPMDIQQIDRVIRELCTTVDDTKEIASLVIALLRKDIECSYAIDQTRNVEDREIKPLTGEYEGEHILKHPDARQALESFLVIAQGRIVDELEKVGKIDPAGKAEAEHGLDEIIENPQSSSGVLDALEDEGGVAGDSERQWRLVIQSFMLAAPKRNYHGEFLSKARHRWMEGLVTDGDLGGHFPEMVNYTSEPEVIEFLVENAVKMRARDAGDEGIAKGLETITLNTMRNMLMNMKADSRVRRKNQWAWFDAVTRYMLRNGIKTDTGSQDA